MLENYWKMMYDLRVAIYYYQLYAVRAKRLKRFISAICLLASSSLLYNTYQSTIHRPLFFILIFAIQLVSVIQPIFPYEKQFHAASYIFQDLSCLALEAENVWSQLDEESEESKVREHINSFRHRQDEIENRFADSSAFPRAKRLHKEAEDESDIYFRRFQNE